MVIKSVKKHYKGKKRIDASVSSTKKASKQIAVDKKLAEVISSPTFKRTPYNLKMIDDLSETGHDYSHYGTPRVDFFQPEDVAKTINGRKVETKTRKQNSKYRYDYGGATGDIEDIDVFEEPPIEEQLPRGTRGDAPRGVIGRVKNALDYKRAHKNFAHKHNLARDSDVPNRFWLDREHWIEVDVFDPLSVKRAEDQIYAFKRNPNIVRASPEYLAQKNAQPKNVLDKIIRHTNPEALKDLYGAPRNDRYGRYPGDRYGRRYPGDTYGGQYHGDIPRSFIDILEGEYPEEVSIIRDYPGRGKKKYSPKQSASWFTGRRVTKLQKKPQNKRK
jgi:hypothetical protein